MAENIGQTERGRFGTDSKSGKDKESFGQGRGNVGNKGTSGGSNMGGQNTGSQGGSQNIGSQGGSQGNVGKEYSKSMGGEKSMDEDYSKEQKGNISRDTEANTSGKSLDYEKDEDEDFGKKSGVDQSQ